MTDTSDVVARLGRELTSDEAGRAPGLLDEASALVAGYLSSAYDSDDRAVVIVESRIVARALQNTLPAGVAARNFSESAGPVSRSEQFTFSPESMSSGGVWLTKADKVMLGHLRSSAVSVSIVTERGL